MHLACWDTADGNFSPGSHAGWQTVTPWIFPPGLDPSQCTMHCSPQPPTSHGSCLTIKTGPPLVGSLEGGHSRLNKTGFSWNTLLIPICLDTFRWMLTGLIRESISNGPMKLGDNFLDSAPIGMFLVDNQTFRPGV